MLLITGGLALQFFFGAGLAKGAVGRLTLVLGVVTGAAIMLNVLDLLHLSFGLLDCVLAAVGGCVRAVLVISFKDWAVILLAGLMGSVLTMRGIGLIRATKGCAIRNTNLGNIFADPRLGPLQNSGGPTKTHALLPGSPAIDNGNPAKTGTNACVATEQRGIPRPQDGDGDGAKRCNIGAFEQTPESNAQLSTEGPNNDTLPSTPGEPEIIFD